MPPLANDALGNWTNSPNGARLCSYFTAGKDYFGLDRGIAKVLDGINPDYGRALWEQRVFRTSVVELLAHEHGIAQFVDLGAGFPDAQGALAPMNIHELATRINPVATTVYVENDPVVAMHLQSAVAHERASSVEADVSDTDTALAHIRKSVDFAQPVAVMLIGLLECLTDRQARDVLAAFTDAMTSGFVVISYAGTSLSTVADYYRDELDIPMKVRTPDELAALLPSGADLLSPGIVPCTHWPKATDVPAVGQYCAVVRVA